ncbi:MAG: hypothetical protein AAGG50_18330 [Bacteroidota bacterium]
MRPAALLGVLAVLALTACVLSPGTAAQPLTFGHALDPLEAPARTGFAQVNRNEVMLRGGPSYIDDRWRLFGGVEARLEAGRLGLGLEIPGRTGIGSAYEEDYDELYDLARRLLYLRLSPTPTSPLYVRLGPLERLRLGSGLLVDGFGTTAAWEERTVGAEVAARLGGVTVQGFLEDLRLDGLVGGALVLEPLGRSTSRLQGIRLTLEGAYDLALDASRGDSLDRPFAAGATLQVPLWGDALAVGPYASGAYQQGLGGEGGVSAEVGFDATAVRFVDLIDAHARVGVFAFDDGVPVTPFDAFYPVQRGTNRIIQADSFFQEPGDPRRPAGAAADAIEAGWGLLFAFDVRLGESFVLAQTARLPVDGQRVGHHRLHAAYGTERGLRFRFAFERGGLNRLSSFFEGFDADLTMLVFDVDYPISPRLLVSMRSRYGFAALPERSPADPTSYIVERRFEPSLGLRLRF